jgi:uncharacterized protein with FMN-binding domain
MRPSMMQANKGVRAFALSLAGACSLTGFIDEAHAATTYLGSEIFYNFGTVQVQITVDDSGKITKIDTPQVSTHGANGSYTSYALPILVSEALKAQSAAIQGVSGASYLSRGWTSSLASAIAQIPKASTSSTPTPTPKPTPVLTPTPAATPTPIASNSPQPVLSPPARGHKEQEGGEREGSDDGLVLPTPIVKSPTPTPTPTPTVKATPTPKPTLVKPSTPPIVLKPGANVIQKTITCVKGTTKKVIKAVNPKCPTGYTLKKP